MALTILATEEMLKGGAMSPLFSVPGLSYLGLSKRRSPINGQQWVLVYESAASNNPTIASPAEVGYYLVPADFTASVDAIGEKHKLTVTTPDDPSGATSGEVINQYELLGNSLQEDLRLHPKALKLGPENIQLLTNVLNEKVKSTSNGVTTYYSASDIPNIPDMKMLYRLFLQTNGNRSFDISQFVFRFTRMVSSRATVDVGYNNVNRIYATDQMISETGAPPGILASISEAVVNDAPEVEPGPEDPTVFGWLKKTPTVVTQANNKMQISGEYWLGQWSSWIYRLAA